MSQATEHIQSMTEIIFKNNEQKEFEVAHKEAAELQADHIKRGVGQSGLSLSIIGKRYDAAVIRAVEKTLEELSQTFRLAGRRDANLFWSSVAPKFKKLGMASSKLAFSYATSKAKANGNVGLLARNQEQTSFLLNQIMTSRLREHELKSKFLILKTPEDRKSNGIPDISVMMWFPDLKRDGEEKVVAAKERYEAIVQAAHEASEGLATIKKFDDPSVVPQERISAEIETWLEKSVLVVCDLAGHRPNVYYEFGYTRAIGTDLILLCPEPDGKDTQLHLGHWQRLEYGTPSDLKSKLIEKMRVLLPKYDLSGTLAL